MITEGRQRVLDGALTLFSQRGYAGTSMRQLAQHLGIQPATLYSHYQGKDTLLATALAPFLDGLELLLRLDHPDLDTRQWLTAYADHLVTHTSAVRLTGADLAVARHQHVGQRLDQLNTATRDLLQRHLDLTPLRAAALLGTLWWPLICLPATNFTSEQR